jgi:multidrug efflux pump subunit AcrB
MFHAITFCSAHTPSQSGRHAFLSMEPGLIGRRMLAAGAALAVIATLAIVPRQMSPAAMDEPGTPLILRAETPSALRDQAEALRARLLATPGVGAVMVTGLHQQRLAIEYAPARLAALGLTPANLAAGLPVDVANSAPGHLALRTDTALDSPEDVVNLPVRAGARVFRLGDVAFVSRAPLDPPVSMLTIDGRPAVRITVVPTN